MNTFTIAVPIPFSVPTEKQIEDLTAMIYPYQKELVESGNYTVEELIAFSDFLTNGLSSLPLMLDTFVNTYRNEIKPQVTGIAVPPKGKIFIP